MRSLRGMEFSSARTLSIPNAPVQAEGHSQRVVGLEQQESWTCRVSIGFG
jgi:hypothetical protein